MFGLLLFISTLGLLRLNARLPCADTVSLSARFIRINEGKKRTENLRCQ